MEERLFRLHLAWSINNIESSFSETRRSTATKFYMVIRSCCSFDLLTQIYPSHPLKFQGPKDGRNLAYFLLHLTLCASSFVVASCLSVCNVEVSWSYRLEFLKNNFTAD